MYIHMNSYEYEYIYMNTYIDSYECSGRERIYNSQIKYRTIFIRTLKLEN